jgi:GTPase SAR1 family protein
MAAESPAISLYEEGLQKFRSDVKRNHPDSSYVWQLQEYLKASNTADDARRSCESLSTETERKYSGVIKIGDTKILTKKWISRILSNIENFIAIGNVFVTGAPESVGLAWFAITKALGAIQSNFQLYALFGSGLTDITETMVTIQHFDNLYDQRTKAEFEASGIVKSLFGHIRSIYAAILDFGFSVHRHISGGKLAQYRHALKDVFGAEVNKFQGKIDLIVDLKRKVLEASDGAFQAKSFQHFGEIQHSIEGIRAHFSEIKEFQETSTEFFEAQKIWQDKLLESMEDFKASNKRKTPWELAMQDFSKIKDKLLPLKNASGPLKEALDSTHEGTCQWVYEHSKYTQWLSPGKSGTLCLTGQPGSGKSTLLASIFQKIDIDTDDERVIVQYMSCDMTSAESGDKSPQSFARITGTLVYQLYERATRDDHNSDLLEACNKFFSNPKQDRTIQPGSVNPKNPDLQEKSSKLITAGRRDVDLPEFVEALRQLSIYLKADVVIAVDAIDRMSLQDQTAFAESLARLEDEEAQTCVRIIVASRTNPFSSSANVIDVGKYNQDDIGVKLRADLQGIKSLSKQEADEAGEKIISEAG